MVHMLRPKKLIKDLSFSVYPISIMDVSISPIQITCPVRISGNGRVESRLAKMTWFFRTKRGLVKQL